MAFWNDFSINEYILYLHEWRTRAEIREHFELSNVSSWHCVKFLSKLESIMSVSGKGYTKRGILYKARAFAIKKAQRDILVEKNSKPETDVPILENSEPLSTKL